MNVFRVTKGSIGKPAHDLAGCETVPTIKGSRKILPVECTTKDIAIKVVKCFVAWLLIIGTCSLAAVFSSRIRRWATLSPQDLKATKLASRALGEQKRVLSLLERGSTPLTDSQKLKTIDEGQASLSDNPFSQLFQEDFSTFASAFEEAIPENLSPLEQSLLAYRRQLARSIAFQDTSPGSEWRAIFSPEETRQQLQNEILAKTLEEFVSAHEKNLDMRREIQELLDCSDLGAELQSCLCKAFGEDRALIFSDFLSKIEKKGIDTKQYCIPTDPKYIEKLLLLAKVLKAFKAYQEMQEALGNRLSVDRRVEKIGESLEQVADFLKRISVPMKKEGVYQEIGQKCWETMHIEQRDQCITEYLDDENKLKELGLTNLCTDSEEEAKKIIEQALIQKIGLEEFSSLSLEEQEELLKKCFEETYRDDFKCLHLFSLSELDRRYFRQALKLWEELESLHANTYVVDLNRSFIDHFYLCHETHLEEIELSAPKMHKKEPQVREIARYRRKKTDFQNLQKPIALVEANRIVNKMLLNPDLNAAYKPFMRMLLCQGVGNGSLGGALMGTSRMLVAECDEELSKVFSLELKKDRNYLELLDSDPVKADAWLNKEVCALKSSIQQTSFCGYLRPITNEEGKIIRVKFEIVQTLSHNFGTLIPKERAPETYSYKTSFEVHEDPSQEGRLILDNLDFSLEMDAKGALAG